MPNIRKLRTPPIDEGLIDFRVTFESPVKEENFAGFADVLPSTYAQSSALHKYEASFAFSDGAAEGSSTSRFAGFRFTDEARKYVFQAQVDGFTLSKLRPYACWEELRDESCKLWEVYVEYFKPRSIERVATRYINRFSLDQTSIEINDYFKMAPNLPDNLSQLMSKFIIQTEVPDIKTESTLLLTQLLEEVRDGFPHFLIDIDIFSMKSYLINDPQVWNKIDSLRDLKNQVFFSILTDKALERFG